MRHNKKKGTKLGTSSAHTKAMKRSLTRALLENDRIKTTVARAKAIRPEVDAIVTWAKKGDLASRRRAIAKLGDAELVREVFEKAEQGMWADRNGGYTRIMRIGNRKGDNAEMALIEMVNETVVPKKSKKAKAEPKATATKVEKVEEEPEEPEVEAEAEIEEESVAEDESVAAEETPAEEEAQAEEEAPAEDGDASSEEEASAEEEVPAEEEAAEEEAPAEEESAEEDAPADEESAGEEADSE